MSEDITAFNDAINILNDINKNSFVFEAWIPSIKRYVKLQEITAKQQKSLLESAIDSEALKFSFNETLFKIIEENCQDEENVINNFTVIDKNSIIIAMRNQLSDKVKVVFKEDPKIEKEIDIKDIISKFEEYNHPEDYILNYSKSGVNIDITVSAPTLKDEYKFDKYIYGNLNKKENEFEEFKGIIGAAFLGETSKYIKEICINNSSTNFSKLHIPQKIQFVERLPAVLVQKIVDKIVSWKSDLEKVSTVVYEDLEKNIELNNLIFLNN